MPLPKRLKEQTISSAVCSFLSKFFGRWPPEFFSIQGIHFICSQMPPLTRLEIAQPQCPDPNTDDPHDWQPQLLARLADLSFTSLPHHDAHPRAFALRSLIADLHRLSLVSILQDHASFPSLNLILIRAPRQQDAIFLLIIVETTLLYSPTKRI